MEALKKRVLVDTDGFIKVSIPPGFGQQVEVIVLPLAQEQDLDDSEYFECVAEDGTAYKVRNWTDDEFSRAGMLSVYKDDDISGEELFDV